MVLNKILILPCTACVDMLYYVQFGKGSKFISAVTAKSNDLDVPAGLAFVETYQLYLCVVLELTGMNGVAELLRIV